MQLSWQRPLRDQKTHSRSFIYSHSSTIPASLVKIGPVDVGIIGLSEIKKNFIKHQQNISPPRLRFVQSEWAMSHEHIILQCNIFI